MKTLNYIILFLYIVKLKLSHNHSNCLSILKKLQYLNYLSQYSIVNDNYINV